jgi:hypothetical protein
MRAAVSIFCILKTGVFLMLAGVVTSETAKAAEYTVRLSEFGSTHPNCTEAIQPVAQAFAASAGVALLGAGCIETPLMRALDGIISYAAPSSVPTFHSDVKDGFGVDGFFNSLESCLAGLEAERAVFTYETGLTPFSGYCFRGNSIGAPRYRSRLDAVGIPVKRKYEISTVLFDANQGPSTIREMVASMVESKGGRVVSVTLEQTAGGWRIAVSWYGDQRYWLSSEVSLAFDSLASCEPVAQALNTNWNSDGDIPTLFGCAARRSSGVVLTSISLTPGPGSADYRQSLLPNDYPSQAVCVADLSRVADQMNRSGGGFIANACGQSPEGSSRAWRMALWTHRP